MPDNIDESVAITEARLQEILEWATGAFPSTLKVSSIQPVEPEVPNLFIMGEEYSTFTKEVYTKCIQNILDGAKVLGDKNIIHDFESIIPKLYFDGLFPKFRDNPSITQVKAAKEVVIDIDVDEALAYTTKTCLNQIAILDGLVGYASIKEIMAKLENIYNLIAVAIGLKYSSAPTVSYNFVSWFNNVVYSAKAHRQSAKTHYYLTGIKDDCPFTTQMLYDARYESAVKLKFNHVKYTKSIRKKLIEDSQFMVRVSHIDSYRKLHECKVELMFDGMTEEEALIALGYAKTDLVFCSVTCQLIPLKYATPYYLGGYVLTKLRDMYPSIFSVADTLYKSKAIHTDNSRAYMYQDSNSGIGYLCPKLDVEKSSLESTAVNYRYPLYMGIELETEAAESFSGNRMQFTMENLGWDYVVLQPDGSLRGYGDANPFEIITAPANLSYHKKKWNAFFDKEPEKVGMQSWKSGRCGMHIHLSRNAFTGLHLAKFLYFINCDANKLFINKVAGRGSTRYSSRTNHKSVAQYSSMVTGSSKYLFVNTGKSTTVELRIFRGNLARLGFMKNLEFAHAAFMYTQYAPMNELDYKAFLRWVFSPEQDTGDYTNLRKWLVNAGLHVSNIVIKKDADKAKRLQLIETRKKVKKIQTIINRRYKKTTSDLLVA